MRTVILFCGLLSCLCRLEAQPVAVEWVATVPVYAQDLAVDGMTAWLALGEEGVATMELEVSGQPVLGEAWAPNGYGCCHHVAQQGNVRQHVTFIPDSGRPYPRFAGALGRPTKPWRAACTG